MPNPMLEISPPPVPIARGASIPHSSSGPPVRIADRYEVATANNTKCTKCMPDVHIMGTPNGPCSCQLPVVV